MAEFFGLLAAICFGLSGSKYDVKLNLPRFSSRQRKLPPGTPDYLRHLSDEKLAKIAKRDALFAKWDREDKRK